MLQVSGCNLRKGLFCKVRLIFSPTLYAPCSLRDKLKSLQGIVALLSDALNLGNCEIPLIPQSCDLFLRSCPIGSTGLFIFHQG